MDIKPLIIFSTVNTQLFCPCSQCKRNLACSISTDLKVSGMGHLPYECADQHPWEGAKKDTCSEKKVRTTHKNEFNVKITFQICGRSSSLRGFLDLWWSMKFLPSHPFFTTDEMAFTCPRCCDEDLGSWRTICHFNWTATTYFWTSSWWAGLSQGMNLHAINHRRYEGFSMI